MVSPSPSLRAITTPAPPRPRIHHTLVLMDDRKAMDYLALSYQGQRSLRAHHIRFLRHLLRAGHWRHGAEIHVARIGSERFLVNGQHSLTAIMTEQARAWMTVVEITVDTLDEVAHLYESFDRNLHRALEDIYQTDPEIRDLGWAKKHLGAASGAVALLATGLAPQDRFGDTVLMLRDPLIRADLLKDWQQEASALFVHLRGPLRTHLLRSGVLSVALVTYRWYAPVAERFWPAVVQDSGLVAGQPAHTLAHFLLSTPARALRPEVYARHVAAAWNAACEEREITRLNPRAVTNPIRLAQTPHDGAETYVYLDGEGHVQHTPIVITQDEE